MSTDLCVTLESGPHSAGSELLFMLTFSHIATKCLLFYMPLINSLVGYIWRKWVAGYVTCKHLCPYPLPLSFGSSSALFTYFMCCQFLYHILLPRHVFSTGTQLWAETSDLCIKINISSLSCRCQTFSSHNRKEH